MNYPRENWDTAPGQTTSLAGVQRRKRKNAVARPTAAAALTVVDPSTPFAPQHGSAYSYAQMLDTLPLISFLASADGAITHVSRSWTEFTGYPEGKVIGTLYRELIDPAQADDVAATWIAAVSGCRDYHDEFRLRLSDGTYRWVLSDAVPLRDASTGAVTAWFGTFTDVDEHRRTSDPLLGSSQRPYREHSGHRQLRAS